MASITHGATGCVMSDVKRFNFTVSQFESVVPYASEHGQYVSYAGYAALEAEAQALREEVKNRTAECNGLHEMLRQEHDRTEKAREEVAALRARVVVPDRAIRNPHSGKTQAYVVTEHWNEGWNACLDELARLNGNAVSEGLLRRMLRDWESNDTVALWGDMEELQELLGEGKEHE